MRFLLVQWSSRVVWEKVLEGDYGRLAIERVGLYLGSTRLVPTIWPTRAEWTCCPARVRSYRGGPALSR